MFGLVGCGVRGVLECLRSVYYDNVQTQLCCFKRFDGDVDGDIISCEVANAITKPTYARLKPPL